MCFGAFILIIEPADISKSNYCAFNFVFREPVNVNADTVQPISPQLLRHKAPGCLIAAMGSLHKFRENGS